MDLPALSAAARDGLVAKHGREFKASSGKKAYHPAAVAHFAGFWADEQDEGSGDFQQARGGQAGCQGCRALCSSLPPCACNKSLRCAVLSCALAVLTGN